MSKIIILPGIVDAHVHLRDPGQTYKEDFFTGTSAALAGGITSVFDMPNNLVPILDIDKLNEKVKIAEKKAVCDWGLYFGTDGNNTDEFPLVYKYVIGLKLYLSDTTGGLIVSDIDIVEKIFQSWPKNKVIVIHAEEEKIDLVIKCAQKYGNKIHITHVNTKEMLKKIILAKNLKIKITCDTTPHYLFLTVHHLEKLQGFSQVKPPLAQKSDQKYLWDNISHIDCIVTDHAPHTKEEKALKETPYGLPGLETMVPLLLTAVKENKLTVPEVIRLTCTGPQKIFGIKATEGTYTEVDIDEKFRIDGAGLRTKCKWSPFNGWNVYGKVKNVFIRSEKVFDGRNILVNPGSGKNVMMLE